MRLCWNTLLTVVMICCCTAAEVAECTRERPLLEDVSRQSAQKRSRKQCQAKNPNCSLERGTSILSGTVEGLDCDICCSKPGFCLSTRLIINLVMVLLADHSCSGAAFHSGFPSMHRDSRSKAKVEENLHVHNFFFFLFSIISLLFFLKIPHLSLSSCF
jgi:hypothetical protein